MEKLPTARGVQPGLVCSVRQGPFLQQPFLRCQRRMSESSCGKRCCDVLWALMGPVSCRFWVAMESHASSTPSLLGCASVTEALAAAAFRWAASDKRQAALKLMWEAIMSTSWALNRFRSFAEHQNLGLMNVYDYNRLFMHVSYRFFTIHHYHNTWRIVTSNMDKLRHMLLKSDYASWYQLFPLSETDCRHRSMRQCLTNFSSSSFWFTILTYSTLIQHEQYFAAQGCKPIGRANPSRSPDKRKHDQIQRRAHHLGWVMGFGADILAQPEQSPSVPLGLRVQAACGFNGIPVTNENMWKPMGKSGKIMKHLGTSCRIYPQSGAKSCQSAKIRQFNGAAGCFYHVSWGPAGQRMSRQPAKRPELEIDIDEAAGNENTSSYFEVLIWEQTWTPVDTEMIKGSP